MPKLSMQLIKDGRNSNREPAVPNLKMSDYTRRIRLLAARQLGTHTHEQWIALRDEFKCCVRCLRDNVELVKDHIIPIYMGGSDSLGNLQPLCITCNSSKGQNTTNWAEVVRCSRAAQPVLNSCSADAPVVLNGCQSEPDLRS